jgi:hypothetical protein
MYIYKYKTIINILTLGYPVSTHDPIILMFRIALRIQIQSDIQLLIVPAIEYLILIEREKKKKKSPTIEFLWKK